jgi:hypothetical protein
MQKNDLFSTYTIPGLLDELDVIECFTEPGEAPIQGEILKKTGRSVQSNGCHVTIREAWFGNIGNLGLILLRFDG